MLILLTLLVPGLLLSIGVLADIALEMPEHPNIWTDGSREDFSSIGGFDVLAIVMKLMCIALSTLSIPLFLLFYSFAGASSPLLMFLRESGIKGLLSLGGMLFWNFGMLYVVIVHVVLLLLFILGIVGSPQIFMASL